MEIPQQPKPERSPQAFERLRVRHLRLLGLLAEVGSLRAAAERMHLTQPAVTQMVRDLEAALGCQLLIRTPRGVQLNAAGNALMQRIESGLASLDFAVESAAMHPATITLRVGLMPVVAIELLPEALGRLSKAGNCPRIILREGAVPMLIESLVRGDIDCFVGRVDWPSLDRRWLADLVTEPLRLAESLQVACRPAHPLFERQKLAPSDLLRYPWALPPVPAFTRKAVEAAFRAHGLALPEPQLESPSFHTSLSAASTTELLTVAPYTAVRRYAGLGLVRPLPVAGLAFPSGGLEFITLRAGAGLPGLSPLREALYDAVAGNERQSSR